MDKSANIVPDININSLAGEMYELRRSRKTPIIQTLVIRIAKYPDP